MSSTEKNTTATPVSLAKEEAPATTVAEVEAVVYPTLDMIVAGRKTSLLPTQYSLKSEDDPSLYDPTRRYWSFREPTHRSGSYGEKVSALAPELPTFVDIDGVRIALEKGTTKEDQRPLVAFNGLQVLPTLGRIVNVIVTMTVTPHGQWWIKVMVTIPESPEVKAKRKAAAAARQAAATTSALFA